MAIVETIIFNMLSSISIIIGSFANLLVIFSFVLFSSVREGTSLFLISLSVADFLVCGVYQPIITVRFNHPEQNQSFIYAQLFLGYCLFTASLNGLMIVTFDRFVAIYFPYKYVLWITETNTARLILLSLVLSLLIGTLNTLQNDFARLFAITYTTAIILAVSIIYGIIYREATNQARRIISQSMVLTRESRRMRHHAIYQATTGVGVVLITTLLCWLPVIVLPIVESRPKTYEHIFWCLLAGCTNSCMNPFIYYIKFPYFRRHIRKFFPRQIRNKLENRWMYVPR